MSKPWDTTEKRALHSYKYYSYKHKNSSDFLRFTQFYINLMKQLEHFRICIVCLYAPHIQIWQTNRSNPTNILFFTLSKKFYCAVVGRSTFNNILNNHVKWSIGNYGALKDSIAESKLIGTLSSKQLMSMNCSRFNRIHIIFLGTVGQISMCVCSCLWFWHLA